MTTAALPSSMGAQMGMAQSQYAAQDVQDKSRSIDSLKRDLNPPKDKAKKLREACEGFESVFIQKMWEQMRATVPKGGMLQGRDEQYWQGMFDQELSKKMSSAGGIGLADMMYEQLSRNLVSASRTTASALGAAASNTVEAASTGFVASAAPLLPPAGPNTAADSANGNAHAGIYGQEVQQPEANAAETSAATAPSQNPDMTAKASQTAQAASAQASPAQNAPQSDTPPEVEQVLAQLRAQNGMTTTMTGAQAIAAVQAMTPAQALGLSQGMSWAQVQAMQPNSAQLAAAAGLSPEMLAQAASASQNQAAPSGLDTARAAAQVANTRMPAGGVLPPMTPMQRQAKINYSAAKVQGSGTSSQVHSPLAPAAPAAPAVQSVAGATSPNAPAAPAVAQVPDTHMNMAEGAKRTAPLQSSTMPLNPNLHSNVQGTPGVSPTRFVQNSALIPNAPVQAASPQAGQVLAGQNTAGAAGTNPTMSMTGEQIAALNGQGQNMVQNMPQGITQNMAQAPVQGQGVMPAGNGQQASPAIPPTAQEPQIINTTFTTNVPPSRRNSRAGQRVPKGQPAIRTLNTGGQG